jgi:transposase
MLIEATTDSDWVARCLEVLGHEVTSADPNGMTREINVA